MMTGTTAAAEFFEGLAARGHEPLLEKATGTMRFDIRNGKRTESWFLTVKKGDLTVSRKGAGADMVAQCERGLLERVMRGKANALAAVLRGEMIVAGDTELLVLFQRLLPRPRDSRRMGRAAGYARRRR